MQTALISIFFISGTMGLAWASYWITRRLAGGDVDDRSRELASSVIFRVSAMHGLILALVFAQEMGDYQRLQESLVKEATAIADIYNDIDRFGGDGHQAVQTALSAYVRLVIDEEWRLLGTENRLSPRGWELRETVYQAILDLPEDNPRQKSLRTHMVSQIQAIAGYRQMRENTALHAMPAMFWFAAIAGVILITIPYFVFQPTRLNLTLLSIYGAYTGIVMLFIQAFSDPFSPPGQLRPAPFERLLETEIGTLR